MAAVGDRAVLVVCDGVTTRAGQRPGQPGGGHGGPRRAGRGGADPGRDGGGDRPLERRAARSLRGRPAGGRSPSPGRSATRRSHRRARSSPPWPRTTTWCTSPGAATRGPTGCPTTASRRQLTVDHSLGTEMVQGRHARARGRGRPDVHTITRWLGADSVDPSPETVASLDAVRAGWLARVQRRAVEPPQRRRRARRLRAAPPGRPIRWSSPTPSSTGPTPVAATTTSRPCSPGIGRSTAARVRLIDDGRLHRQRRSRTSSSPTAPPTCTPSCRSRAPAPARPAAAAPTRPRC